MHGPRKHGRGHGKPAAKSGCNLLGCLLCLVLFPVLIPLAVIVWCAAMMTGGLVKAALTPPKGGD